MKKNKWIWIILIIIILAGGIGAYLYFTNNSTKNENKESEYEANKTSTTEENKTENNKNEDNKNITNIEVPATQPQYKEETIATFSTKVYNKESARQNNINITCNTLNNTTVKNGETFSFCNTVRTSHNCKRISKSRYF